MEAPTPLRPSRRDALPEHTSYADTGCDLHPSCLNCPLVRCRYDEPGGARRILSKERDQAIITLQRQGRSISAIAGRFGISRRTVFRVLARSKQQATGARQGKESIRVLERSR
jgi:transposase-like protein